MSSAQVALYADDTTLTSATNYESIDVLQSSLTIAISEVDEWATANKLPLNEIKTKVLTITGKRLSTRVDHDLTIVVNGKQLENVQCAKLLGLGRIILDANRQASSVNLSNKLKWIPLFF